MKSDTMTIPAVSIRLRLTPDEVAGLEDLRRFMGLRSVSSVAARLVRWNASEMHRVLGLDVGESSSGKRAQ